MGKIRQLREDQLINGGSQEHIYPITHARAVYSKDKRNLQDILEGMSEGNFLKDGSITTPKIGSKAVTVEKLAEDSVTTDKIKDESVTEDKLAESSVGTSKIKDGAVTNDKVANDSLTRDKLDPELRNTLDAATGLPEDLIETIQNVDKTLKDHQSQLDDKQSQINDKQQQITANDEDISLLQTRSTQMEETIKGIAATGGASQATAVTYNNEKSKLTAVNIQSAVDEVVDKDSIKDEEGNVVGTPFRVINNEEFIMAVVDSENRLLFGIYRATGKPYFPQNDMYHISHSEEFLWVILDTANHPLLGIQQDGTCWAAKAQWLDDINAIKKTLSSINETIKTFQPKEDGKGLINLDVADSFFYISNDEYIIAVVDVENRILAGIKYDGKPYYPLNEMYHVIQNDEYFALWLDAADHVLLGIRRDGQIIGEIHAVNALKQVISQLQSDVDSLQEKVGTIDTNLKELLDVFSLQDNEEYLAVEQDAEGKILSATNPDGSHYLYKVKSETIPTEFEHIEDPEGRTEITTDSEDKILGYRDSEGTRHEHKISAKHLELSDEAAYEVNEAFKSAGIKMENPSDFSKDNHIELPIPRIAAQVRIYAPKLPTTKQDDIEAEIEYNDKDGNYFRKPVILNAQGSSSMSYYVKNMAIDIVDGSEIKFGDFPTQDSFHLKKYYIDIFRGQCIVGYWLMEQVYKSRPIGQQYPYEYSYSNESSTDSLGDIKKDFFTGAKCHPDGFPVVITWVNTTDNTETDMGIYAWNLKKAKEVYFCDKKKAENIILDGVINSTTLFGGNIDWTAFEIRNPKSLIDIDGNKYDGDNPKELSDTDINSKKVKEYLTTLSGAYSALQSSKTKETFEKYFLPKPFIDYLLLSQIIYNFDGFNKNWIWVTYDGIHWTPTAYDLDSIFGAHWQGTCVDPKSAIKDMSNWNNLSIDTLYKTEIEERYKELRDKNIFSVDNIVGLLNKWLSMVGFDNIEKEITLYKETPSYRSSSVVEGWKLTEQESYRVDTFNIEKEYHLGDKCVYDVYVFEATKTITGVVPVEKQYTNYPYYLGFHNSVNRVKNWLTQRIVFLDNLYNYNK